MSRRPRNAVALCVLAAGLVAGCGTTVPQAQLQANGSLGSSDGLSVGPTGGPSAGSPGSGAAALPPGSSVGQGVVPPTGGAAVPGAVPAGTTGTTAGGPVSSNASPVRVGLLYISGADSAAQTLGISNLSTGDPVAQTKAIAAYLNQHGGLAGHRIVLYYGKMAASQMLNDPNSAHAAACAQLTEDDKVSYVVSYVQLSADYLACYTQHGVTMLDDQSSVPDSVGARAANLFASPGELALGRASRELVDDLWQRGWLTSTSKVGTYVYDTPEGVELETKYLVPALKAHGITPAVTARASMNADGANQNGTVLQFRSHGVDRVIPIGASPIFLMEAAESQNYRPAYAVTSTWGPGALIESAAPKNQLRNAAGIGWSKFLDIGNGKMPGPVSANETLCFQIMKKNGQASSSKTVKAFQVALCNVLMSLQIMTQRFGLSSELLPLVRQARLTIPPADAFAVRMEPGRADGVGAYRDIAYETNCQCFQYTSGNRATS